jgi:hypothetical protein
MLMYELLREMHFSDLYPRSFMRFYEKYASQVHDDKLYVNFTDAVGNTIDKRFSPKPTHRDPSGLYTYPLEYIISHSANVEYGQQARYLRVIRDTSHHKLLLNTMTQEQAVGLLTKMGVADPEKRMAFVQRRYKYVGGNVTAKQFFGVLQTYLEVGQKHMTSNVMQSALLRKAGIDALEDRSASATEAVIYQDEPEQCVFLTRAAFRVIDVFELRQQAAGRLTAYDPTERLKRLPGLIAQAIGDHIIANNMIGDRESAMTFYTAAKRKIVINLKRSYRFLDDHRGVTDFSKDEITVALFGPDIAPIRETYPPETTFQNIAADIKAKFTTAQSGEGQTYDRETELGAEIKATNDLVAKVCARLKLPFTMPTDAATAYLVYRTVKHAKNMFGIRPYAKTDIDTIRMNIPDIWRGKRDHPQWQQLSAMWQKASWNRKVKANSIRDLTKIASDLGIKVPQAAAEMSETGVLDEEQMGDVTVFRRGNTLMIRKGDQENKIADINNLQLDGWKAPIVDHDHTIMLPHAKAMIAYLNRHRYFTEGYVTYLPTYFGFLYYKDRYRLFEDVAQQIDTIGDMPVYRSPDRVDRLKAFDFIMAKLTAEKDHSDLGPGYAGVVEKWPGLEIILTIDSNNTITAIPRELVQYVKAKKNNETYRLSSYESMYGGSGVGSAFIDKLEAANFDLLAFCAKHGFKPSASLNSSELELFGMKSNRDNGKIGKTYREVMNPIGEFDGLEVYTVVPNELYTHSDRYFFVKDGDKFEQIMRCERDHHNGQSNVKIVAIGDDLTPEQRATTRALIKHEKLAVPVKFRAKLK